MRGAVVATVLVGLLAGTDRSVPAAAPSRFSIELRDADIRDVLRALGQESHLNVVFGEEVQGKITLSFHDVTLHEALGAILRIQNLNSMQEGNILWIVRSPFAEGEAQLITKTITVQYADADELSNSIRPLLSDLGRLAVDKRTNTLVVRDTLENTRRILAVVSTLDERTPQVLIEAQIVEADVNFARDIGVQWGVAEPDRHRLGASGVGGAEDTGGTGRAGGKILINTPAAVGPGSGGTSGFSFGSIPNASQLDLQLNAMRNSGRGRILSSPKILTQNDKQARVSTGLTIPVLTSTVVTSSVSTPAGAQGSQATTGVANINVDLSLTVTPHVTPGNQIGLKLLAEKKEADFSREVHGIPTLTTREASTEMIARDGETVVIRGIFETMKTTQRSGIPVLSAIPWVGRLFTQESVTDVPSELLIFVTPHLYGGGGSTVSALPSP
jgi:type IV pilus assembly protein PilQ